MCHNRSVEPNRGWIMVGSFNPLVDLHKYINYNIQLVEIYV